MDRQELEQMKFASQSIHGGHQRNQFGALATPIYQTSTFVFDTAEQGGLRFALEEEGYIYTRLGNPTVTQVEERLSLLEKGEAAVATSSGIGAVTSAIWVSVNAGDHIVAAKTLYGCTYAYLSHGISRFGVEVTFVDTRHPEEVKKALRPNTKVLYLETPANPNMYISDIEQLAAMAHANNPECLVYVDNTFCTPYLQRPLEMGADVVIHSATKYLNGHGDVIAGFIVGKKEFIDQARLVGVKDMTGASMSPFDAFLIGRGMKTLKIRMDEHCKSAQLVAEFLAGHPAVKEVLYPGLPSFPQYDLAKKQMSQSGAIISFLVQGGLEGGKKLLNSLHLCSIAVSLGDTETLIQHPASMTHSPYTPEERAESGIPEDLVRISIGLEHPDDIIADLKQGLDKL